MRRIVVWKHCEGRTHPFISVGVFSLASNQEMSYNTVLSVASVGERLLLQEEAVLIAAHGAVVLVHE